MRRPLTDLPYQPNPDVVAQRVQEEVVLVNLRTNEIYTLNKTAARAWELLAESEDRSVIEAKLASEFSADASVVGGELDVLLDELLAKELIQRT
jgi:Coenzyme PQQ synthesis protein D (PqqD)